MKSDIRSRDHRAFLSLVAFAAALLVPVVGRADCDPAAFQDKTLDQYYECVYQEGLPKSLTDPVKNSNAATTAPDAFADRIHASYQDFLKFLSFAVDSVDKSSDGRSFTVRLNPFQRGSHHAGITLTAAKPEVSDAIRRSIPEEQRAEVVGQLEDALDDEDDLTVALSYTRESKECGASKLATSGCWGRTPRLYRQALSLVLARLEPASENSEAKTAIALKLITEKVVPDDFAGDLFQEKPSVFVAGKEEAGMALIKALAEASAKETVESSQVVAASGLDQISTLIDNQPQLAGTVSYRDFGPLSGPNETGATLEFQWGGTNLNSLYKKTQGDPDAILRTVADYKANGFPSDKFVVSATYKRRDSYSLAKLPLSESVAGFTPVSLESSSELKVHGQWGRQIGDYSVVGMGVPKDVPGTQRARWDLSFEGIRTKLGNEVSENRWIAAWTLTLPMTKLFSLPLTVSYANKSDFLEDSRKRLGAHIGITYKLPWEPTASAD